MTWLSGWNYRKSKIVNGTTFGSQTNYTLQLNVFKGSGTDTNTDIYLNNNCNNDFSDVRFTSLDGVTLLDYYIKSMTTGVSAIINIEIDSIPASPGTTNIYLYYGNETATSQSNGDNTFLLFDYFGIIDTNKWQVLREPVLLNYLGNLRVRFPTGMVTTKNPIPLNCEIEYQFGPGYTLYEDTKRDIKLAKEITQRNFCRYSHNAYGLVFRNTSEGVSQTFSHDRLHIIRHTLGGNWVLIVGGSVVQTQPSLRTSGDVLYLHFASTDDNCDVAYVIIRKYASPEPIFGVTGAEETALGDVCIKSNPPGASITIDGIIQPGKITAMSEAPCIIDNTVVGLTPGTNNHSYEINLTGYQPKSGTFAITSGLTTILDIPLTPLSCPSAPKYEGNTITLNATPKDGIGPYYVEFFKDGVTIDPLRLVDELGNPTTNPILSAPENTLITRVYTLDDLDISSALLGTIDFSVFISDSCPTGAKTCTDTCTITIGCIAPVCNFQVT